jgi:hypothetical protein
LTTEHTGAPTPGLGARGWSGGRARSAGFADRDPFRSVSRNGIDGIPAVSGIEQYRFDHAVASMGAIDSARYAIRHIGLDGRGFDKVVNLVDALRVAVLEQGHRVWRVCRP